MGMKLLRQAMFWLLLGLPFLSGCLLEVGDSEEEDKRVKVWVSIPPQIGFIKKVGGEDVAIAVMVPEGQALESFKPDLKLKEQLAFADIVFGIGAPFERALFDEMKVQMSWVGVVDTGPLMSYDPGGMRPDFRLEDPHLWMDPVTMVDFAILTYQGLSSERPRKTLQFKDLADVLVRDLKALNESLQERFRPYGGRAFYINHASLGHFARRYGLNQRPIPDRDKAPAAEEIEALAERARADGIGAVFVQPEFGRAKADALAAALGVPVVEIDVLAEDYFANLENLAIALEESFK